MTKARIIWTLVAAGVIGNMTPMVVAQVPPDLFLEKLDDFIWTGAGNGTTWQNAANWTPPVGFNGQFPDDPGRNDTDQVVIVPVEGANFSIALTSDLTVNISGGDVTVASLKLGGTGAAVTTNINSSTNHLLVFENQEQNDTMTNPGDPMADPPIEPEPIWSFNQARALIWSTGTTGAGKENRINADIKLNDDVDVEGDRDIHIYGDVLEGDRLTAAGATFRLSSISSLLTSGAALHIHGNIQASLFDEDIAVDGTQDRIFGLNATHGVALPADPQNPPNEEDEVSRQGRVDMHGRLIGDGWVGIGSPQDTVNPVGTVILRADSRDDPGSTTDQFFSGRIVMNRGNLVLAHDGSLGSGDIATGNPNQAFGFNFVSTDDARNIANELNVAQWHTVAGATDIPGLESFGDHSIEFSGTVIQNNSRGWINLLPAGETLTLSGPQYPIEGGDNTDTDRIYTMDGSGKTLITGGIHNRPPDGINPGNGHLRVRGTTTVLVDFDESKSPGDSASDYSGATFVEGGNLHFATNEDLAGTQMHATSGAVGVDTGVVSNSTFLGMLNNSSTPNHAASSPFFLSINTAPIFALYDSGGLMLASGEYTQSLDFNSGDLTKAANMTLAAREIGSTYTGTITPNSSVVVNPNTYQLGGGAGTLTLPNNNQLTGTRSLLATNGSEVRLEGSNNYTGTTRIVAKVNASNTTDAAASVPGIPADETEFEIEGQGYRQTMLTLTNLANGGAASGIGSSSSAAANLHIQGSVLKYVGPAVSTDRLFTVGTAGATIDASGTGALTFTNTSNLGIDIAENRTGAFSADLTGGANNEVFGHPEFVSGTLGRLLFSTEDLVPGMAIRDINPSGSPTLDADLVIASIGGDHAVRVGEAEVEEGETPWPGVSGTFIRTFTFGPAPPRMLTLSGTNIGNNTLASVVADASDIAEPGGAGSVGITKTDPGKWVLTGSNTYTGNTVVEEGTLSISNDFLADTGDVWLTSGATFNLNFSDIDVIDSLFIDDMSQAIGTWGAIGNAAAMFHSPIITGAGILQVSSIAETGIFGDYNNNGVVDAADYVVWRRNLGTNTELLNEDPMMTPGMVTQEDYDLWRSRFGFTTNPGEGAGSALDSGAVPEPSSALLASLALVFLGGVARRGR